MAVIARVALLVALLAAPAAAQVQVQEEVSSGQVDAASSIQVEAPPEPVLDGPPPPVAPAVINRDAAGGATIRAVRVSERPQLDGVLDESIYETITPITGVVQPPPPPPAPVARSR